MTPSYLRQLDALVAQKIFSLEPCLEWRAINFGSAGGPALAHTETHADQRHATDVPHYGLHCYPDPSLGGFAGPAKYTTDPVASKQLREHFREKGWDCLILARASHDQYGNPPFDARLIVGHFAYELGDERRAAGLPSYIQVYGESEEHAFVVCALTAKQIPIPEMPDAANVDKRTQGCKICEK